MTRSIGYSQCSVLMDINYPNDAHYQQVNLSLVKNEPLDSIEYLPINGSNPAQTYQYVQHQQPAALILPPSPSDAQPTGHHCNSQINQANQLSQSNQQANQISQVLNQPTNSPISSQINKISSQVKCQVSNQINARPVSQTNSQPTNQIKSNQPYLGPIKSQLILTQPVAGKYRKKPMHSLAKPYQMAGSEQLARNQIKSGNSISRRNERERRRVRNVNNGFQELRKRIPQGEKKLSKVETLRKAVEYIKNLQEMLNGADQISESSTELLFSILQQNASSLNALVHSESSNSQITVGQSQGSQQDSSMMDYFDLTELLSH